MTQRPQPGQVLSIEPGRGQANGTRADADLKVGDAALRAQYSGTDCTLEDEELLVRAERDILAVIESGTR